MSYSLKELMAVCAAREFRGCRTAFVGTGLPMVAGYLAKKTVAPDCSLIFESGIVDPQPVDLALGVGDFKLLHGATFVAGLLYTLGLLTGGKIDLGFLGAAQVDRFGNINSTTIGDYHHPRLRLPGSGGANDIASMAGRVVVIVTHEARKFPERVSYVTSPGYLKGGDARAQAGLLGGGPKRVITDLGVLGFDAHTHEMVLQSVHPSVDIRTVMERTGFRLEISPDLETTVEPSEHELHLLRTAVDPHGVYIT